MTEFIDLNELQINSLKNAGYSWNLNFCKNDDENFCFNIIGEDTCILIDFDGNIMTSHFNWLACICTEVITSFSTEEAKKLFVKIRMMQTFA